MCLSESEKNKFISSLQGMKPSRFEHTMGVCKTAVTMAKRFGADVRRTETAALLHDIAKRMSHEELRAEAQKYGIEAEGMYASPALLHSTVGAEMAKHELGIDDEYIIDAIRFHTVGRAEMSDVEKIVYIADMIEESRSYPGVEELRKAAEEDLDKALFLCVKHVIEYIVSKGDPLATESVELYNSMCAKYQEV